MFTGFDICHQMATLRMCVFVIHDFHLLSPAQIFQMLISWNDEHDDSQCINAHYGFMVFDICHRTAPLQKLYSVTLTYIFKVKYFFQMVISQK